jgi:hypothetical protein
MAISRYFEYTRPLVGIAYDESCVYRHVCTVFLICYVLCCVLPAYPNDIWKAREGLVRGQTVAVKMSKHKRRTVGLRMMDGRYEYPFRSRIAT